MILKNNKKLQVSALAGIISIGALAGGYSILNKDITLVVKGKESSISTFKSNVKDVLEEQNVKYDGNDIISLALDTKLKDGTKIEVTDVREEIVRENKEVPFEVNIVEDGNMLKGNSEVKSEGKEGLNELVYKITYHNGKKVEKTFVEEVVAQEPVNRVINKGTKVEVQVASSRGESTRVQASSTQSSSSRPTNNNKPSNNNSASNNNNRKKMTVVATAYSGDTITSTGTTPKWGTIAVDPKVIPYGTKVYIPQFDMTFIAEDTGGAIKGNKIDIFMPDASKVSSWGRKSIDIYIIG